MRLLLDTHLLLWAAANSKRLSREARELLEDAGNNVYYSAASIWEIAIKNSLRRKDFRIKLPRLLSALPDMGLIELPITEPLVLLTNDALLERYRVGARIV
jgi:PIN domain nuclease of toxin-antitoxin system